VSEANVNEYMPLEKLLEKCNSIYKLVIMASRRASELNNGQPKLVEAREGESVSTAALREIVAGKITYEISKESKKGSKQAKKE